MCGDFWSLGERTLAHQPGSQVTGSDVADLQVLLDRLGYRLNLDGSYGPSTVEQVGQFQKHRGLRADGVVGPITLRELLRVRDLVTSGRPHLRPDRPS